MNKTKDFWMDCYALIRGIHRESKSTIPLIIAGSMLEAAPPFISMIFGAEILDAMIGGADREEIMGQVYLMIGLTLVIVLLSRWLARLYRISAVEINGKTSATLAYKCLTMDFAQLETQGIMSKKQRADAGKSAGGGLFLFCLTAAKLFGGIFSILYALTALAVLLVPKPSDGLSVWPRVLSNPLTALLLLAFTVSVSMLGLPLLRKANQTDYEIFDVNAESNRSLSVYINLRDYHLGKEIRTYGFADFLLRRMKLLTDRLWSRSERFRKKRDLLRTSAASFSNLGLLMAYGFAGLKAMAGLATVGEVTVYVGAITSLASAIRLVTETLGTLNLQRRYLKEYEDFLAVPSERYAGSLPVEKRTDSDYEIAFHNVSFRYPNREEKSLRNVSFALKKGVKLAVVGPNGAGKTTFIKLLCRLYDPTEGEITLNGIDIRKYDYQEYLSLLSVVFQDFCLFSMELGQNVAADTEYDPERVWECLFKAGIGERALTMENGLHTGLYKREKDGVEISGGEAQKIAIARALYKGAPIVILDEPTSALDPISEYEIYRRFDNLVEGHTSIYISHRMSSCRFCDEILVFQNGQIMQYGSHKALMKEQDGLYRKMWDAQADYYRIPDSGNLR